MTKFYYKANLWFQQMVDVAGIFSRHHACIFRNYQYASLNCDTWLVNGKDIERNVLYVGQGFCGGSYN